MEGWQEHGLRSGRIQVRAQPAEKGISFEAWFDSLAVEYTRPAGKLKPDTDGLIGGRWNGLIYPHGEVSLVDRPFMPPELADVSDLSDQLIDFFPPLATASVAPGRRWTDSLGLEIERLRDSTAGTEVLQRYRWRISNAGTSTPGDTAIRLRQEIEDEGHLAWSASRGPVAWRREIEVSARVGAARRGGTPSEGRVTQEVRVRRVTNPVECR